MQLRSKPLFHKKRCNWRRLHGHHWQCSLHASAFLCSLYPALSHSLVSHLTESPHAIVLTLIARYSAVGLLYIEQTTISCVLSVFRPIFHYQCRINYGSSGSPEPGPLNSGGGGNFTEIIFIHTNYIKN